MKIAISAITENGLEIAERLSEKLIGSRVFNLQGKGLVRTWTNENFHKFDGHVYIMSMGIVYRVISTLITNKYKDPAVVIIDDANRYSIAALSGHEGGANALAFKTAQILHNEPVITTASDTNKRIVLGVGCRRGTSAQAISSAVTNALKENNLEVKDVRLAASVDIKSDEKGMIDSFDELKIPLLFISSKRIKEFTGYQNLSKVAMKQLGIPGVSEPCSLLAGRDATLIMERKIYGDVTIALAKEDSFER